MRSLTKTTLTNMFAFGSCLALMLVGLSPNAHGDAWNKKTILTVNEQIQVPNKMLEPGKYVFKLADSQSDRHIVQIFNEDESHIITTILAIPNYRLKPRGKSEFDFWETPAGMPRALRAWFYPGDNFGQEFAYKPSMSVQIAAFNKKSVVTTYARSDQDLKTAKVEQSNVEETTEVARNVEPISEPTAAPVVAEPAPEVVEESQVTERVQADAPEALPQTASDYPLIALVGLLSLSAFTVMTVVRPKRSS